MSLVITIIVMIILASVTTVAGLESIKIAKKTTFITELEMVQSKVNTIYEKRKLNTSDVTYYDSLGQDISVVDQEKLITILKDVSIEEFRYFSREDLKKLELENIEQDVLIDYDTRAVYSYQGINIDGITYYRLQDIPDYTGYNVEYENSNDQAPSFLVDVTEETDNWRISLKDIVYNSNVSGGTVSHKLFSKTNWILDGEKTSFIVYEPGLYDIRLTDRAGNSTIVQKFIRYDYITDGLIAYYDAECNIQDGHSDTTTVWRDLSGNNHDATLENFDFNDTSGWEKSKVVVDETDDTITFPAPINQGESMSIQMLVTVKDFLINHMFMGDLGWSNFNSHIYNNNGNIFIGGNYIANENNRFNPSDINYQLKLNELEYITYTYDATKREAKFYVQDQLLATKTFINDPEEIKYFTTGSAKKDYTRISIYNKVLTLEEVKHNYEIDKYRFGITE